MAQTDSLLSRFEGDPDGDGLIEVLSDQTLVRGEREVARALYSAAELREFQTGEMLILQGAATNDMYLILSGSAEVVVNGRTIAVRKAGQHVGEMALIDPAARRSATVVAKEPSLVAIVGEAAFTRIANEHPQVWRRIAVEMSDRLRQRNRFLSPPRNQPVMFVGSSSENLDAARAIHDQFSEEKVVVTVWTTGVFRPSSTSIESLIEFAHGCDFAAIALSPDDRIVSRRAKYLGPRDNVIFELGLFMGCIGRDRTFLVVPDGVDVKIPTDLLGIVTIGYPTGPRESLSARMASACNEIRKTIERLGPR